MMTYTELLRTAAAIVANPAAHAAAPNVAAALTRFADLDTENCLVLSTAHITRETAGYLNHQRSSCYDKGDYGWFIHVGQDDGGTHESDPPSLVAVLAYARAAGYDWVCLDCDGNEVDALPVFEW